MNRIINYLLTFGLAYMVILFVISVVSEALYNNPPPDQPVFSLLETGQTPVIADQTTSSSETTATYSANIDNGQRQFRQCAVCHSIQADGANRIGPNIYNIIDRPIAIIDNFGYSRAMRQMAENGATWTLETLNTYLKAPQRTVPGTTMSFIGIKNDQDRLDLLAYLKSLQPDLIDQ